MFIDELSINSRLWFQSLCGKLSLELIIALYFSFIFFVLVYVTNFFPNSSTDLWNLTKTSLTYLITYQLLFFFLLIEDLPSSFLCPPFLIMTSYILYTYHSGTLFHHHPGSSQHLSYVEYLVSGSSVAFFLGLFPYFTGAYPPVAFWVRV